MSIRRSAERLWLSAAQASGILEIEASKKAVAALETALEAATNRRAAALASHDEVVSQHASTQQQLTSLMQRRESWDSVDVTRFTELTAKEHALKGGISAALHERSEAEVEAERAQRSYLRAMQDKYAAEILLGEKNKLLSTGVWLALLACNTTIFVGTQVLLQRREAHRADFLREAATSAAVAAVAAERERLFRQGFRAASVRPDDSRGEAPQGRRAAGGSAAVADAEAAAEAAEEAAADEEFGRGRDEGRASGVIGSGAVGLCTEGDAGGSREWGGRSTGQGRGGVREGMAEVAELVRDPRWSACAGALAGSIATALLLTRRS